MQRTSNDNIANASLPGNALSTNIRPGSANGRAVGLNTPPAMFANGTVGQGGPYDGIVTLNSSKPFQFSRPVNGNNFDAQRITEHEIDEVIGLGSRIGDNSNDLRPQDLFSWSSAGHRNITSSGTRYFSINGGVTNIVGFNQDPDGDFGDWLSAPCPQAHPYPQNAFSCTGQSSDIAATSPEGINLDVIGYDLANALPSFVPYDFNGDSKPDYVLYNAGTQQTTVWYLNNNVYIGGALHSDSSCGLDSGQCGGFQSRRPPRLRFVQTQYAPNGDLVFLWSHAYRQYLRSDAAQWLGAGGDRRRF